MAKWADYLISEKSYDSDRKHIERLKVHKDLGDEVGSSSIWKRKEVVDKIESGFDFCTILKNPKNEKWKKGADVHVIKVNKKKYLRTDSNNVEKDNLGDLPEF